jgi:hypothetical protein
VVTDTGARNIVDGIFCCWGRFEGDGIEGYAALVGKVLVTAVVVVDNSERQVTPAQIQYLGQSPLDCSATCVAWIENPWTVANVEGKLLIADYGITS